MRKEIVFSIRDLRYVSIQCQHCSTEVVLDQSRFETPSPAWPYPQPAPETRTSFAPLQCPACRVPYDTALTALDDLQRACSGLAKVNGLVRFRAADVEGGE